MGIAENDLQEFAEADVTRMTELSIRSIREQFGDLDDVCMSAVILLHCAKTLETAAFEIAGRSDGSLTPALILKSAELAERANFQWQKCMQSVDRGALADPVVGIRPAARTDWPE